MRISIANCSGPGRIVLAIRTTDRMPVDTARIQLIPTCAESGFKLEEPAERIPARARLTEASTPVR